jgi:hypothetical protein
MDHTTGSHARPRTALRAIKAASRRGPRQPTLPDNRPHHPPLLEAVNCTAASPTAVTLQDCVELADFAHVAPTRLALDDAATALVLNRMAGEVGPLLDAAPALLLAAGDGVWIESCELGEGSPLPWSQNADGRPKRLGALITPSNPHHHDGNTLEMRLAWEPIWGPPYTSRAGFRPIPMGLVLEMRRSDSFRSVWRDWKRAAVLAGRVELDLAVRNRLAALPAASVARMLALPEEPGADAARAIEAAVMADLLDLVDERLPFFALAALQAFLQGEISAGDARHGHQLTLAAPIRRLMGA